MRDAFFLLLGSAVTGAGYYGTKTILGILRDDAADRLRRQQQPREPVKFEYGVTVLPPGQRRG